MYGDDDDDRPKRDAVPANTLTLDEIHRLEALIDARLKFGGKKTLARGDRPLLPKAQEVNCVAMGVTALVVFLLHC